MPPGRFALSSPAQPGHLRAPSAPAPTQRPGHHAAPPPPRSAQATAQRPSQQAPRASWVLPDFSCNFGVFYSQSLSVGWLIRPVHVFPDMSFPTPFAKEAEGFLLRPPAGRPQFAAPWPWPRLLFPHRQVGQLAQLLASLEPRRVSLGKHHVSGAARPAHLRQVRGAAPQGHCSFRKNRVPGKPETGRHTLWLRWLRHAALEEMSLPLPSSYGAEILTKDVKF